MKRTWAILPIAAALAASLAISGEPTAQAANAAQAYIGTYTVHQTYSLDGFGDKRGWYFHNKYFAIAELQPRVAWYAVDDNSWSNLSAHDTQDYLVGNRQYYKLAPATTWTVTSISAAQLKRDQVIYNPFFELNLFYAIPGVRKVGTYHYRVTCTAAQVRKFWVNYLGRQYDDLTMDGIADVTIDLRTDPHGRPATLLITGQSSDVKLRLVLNETFNQPVKIHAPA